jgi:hypothetical protein
MKLSQLKEEIRNVIREVKLEEGFTNPKVSNPAELAKTVLGWFDFYTDYIDDGGQRRRAIQKNDNTLEWFGSHPVDVKQKAYKIMVAQAKGDKSKIERTFGKHLKEVVTEDKSLKRFLDPFTWLKYSDGFQRRFRNVSPSVVQELIKITKENGHGVLIIDKNAFATLDKNPKELEEGVWKYYNGDLYYVNPKSKSIYDTLIPKLVNSKKEVVIKENTKRVKLLGIDFNVSEMNGRIFFSFVDKKAASIQLRQVGTNKIVNHIQKRLDIAYGKGEFFFKSGDHAEFQNGYLFQRNTSNINLNKIKFEVVTEEKKYDIGSGWMGNGLTIWNRAEETNGEYKIIAHIGKDGTLKIYDKALPNDIKKMFQMWADTMKKGDRPGIY